MMIRMRSMKMALTLESRRKPKLVKEAKVDHQLVLSPVRAELADHLSTAINP